MKLENDQHERFCQEYLIDLNGTKAAERSKYSKKTATVKASQLLTKVNIQKRIAELQEIRARRTEVNQDRVLKELACIGHSNIKRYIKNAAKGFIEFRDIDNISEEDAKAIESIKVNYEKGHIEFKLYSKTKALEMEGRHLGMFVEKIEHSGELEHTVFIMPRPKEKEKKEDGK